MLRWRAFTLPSLLLRVSIGEPMEAMVGVGRLVGVEEERELGDL